MPSGCCGSLDLFDVPISSNKSAKELLKRTTSRQLFCYCKRECLFSLESMEVKSVSSRSSETLPLEHSTSANGQNKHTEKETNNSVFINHAAIAWHESRRKWTGDQSRKPKRMEKDPIISWSTTYEELLSTHEPFSEPIPLPEMVDFLVDIWHDDGLFD